MTDKNIKLKIVTQNKIVYEGEVDAFYTDTLDGRIGLLPNHIPITSVLEIGVTKVIKANEPTYIQPWAALCILKTMKPLF